ncbi:YdaU family protein [Lysobacter sp. HA18]
MKAADVHFVRFHLNDHQTSTAHLSALEHGVYVRMLHRYYSTERPLPNDVGDVCRVARAASTGERKAVKSLLVEFFTLKPDGWRHRRCDKEIARYYAKSEQARDAANARWGNVDDADGMQTHSEGAADDMPPQCARNASRIASSHKPPTSELPPPGDISPAVAFNASDRPNAQLQRPETGFREQPKPQPPQRRTASTDGLVNAADLAAAGLARANGACHPDPTAGTPAGGGRHVEGPP